MPRPPSGHSLLTVDTMDIDGLAIRNEERARRLEAILNARKDDRPRDHRTILDTFMGGSSDGELNGRGQQFGTKSEVSLDCETTFYPAHQQD